MPCSSVKDCASNCGTRRNGISGATNGWRARSPQPTCPLSSKHCRSEPQGPKAASMVDVDAGHTAVLLPQVLAALSIRASGTYLDATFGRGGHAEAILEKLTQDGRMLCLDRDPVAIAEAKARLASASRVALFLAPFSALEACADAVEPRLKLDGILFDLGVSSPQLDDSERGFSFMQDGPLDMRMSRAGTP